MMRDAILVPFLSERRQTTLWPISPKVRNSKKQSRQTNSAACKRKTMYFRFENFPLLSEKKAFYFSFLAFSDSRAPNLGRSTCTMISGCYSPANPSKWTQGSLMSWNLSPRCQETPNTPPVCDPQLDPLTLSDANAAPLVLPKEGGRETDRLLEWWTQNLIRLDETRNTCTQDTGAHMTQCRRW